MLSAFKTGNAPDKHCRNDGEVLGHVVGDRKRGERTARHQQLLADLDNLDELRRIGVEIDHVAGFLRGLRAGVHGDTYVGLRQRGSIVGAVAGHRNELALALFALDQVHLVLGLGLGEKIVHAGLARDHRGSQRIVAGDHDGANAHRAEAREPLFQATFDDVFQINDAESRCSSPPPPAAFRPRAQSPPRYRGLFLAATNPALRESVRSHRLSLCG